MYILGINAYHGDAAAAIIKDGELMLPLEPRTNAAGIDKKEDETEQVLLRWQRFSRIICN
ncbi:MAG TPA: hypothetical protein VFH31_16360 [Pyrinomonadaceae bacterium]|nr:hypothetical protein [Pyrinomonadaceae bacterium]